ncbi:adenosine deaminase [Pseudofrankia sp. DC12]|uniref:adenosine deaminase n=1 Tax=Pseudofrankia sp. DC12 TaxID=683315 RepID=UPI0005F7E8AA|nr:adenosine deaminase [Pseudofrankia sp. DC12]
MASPTLDQIRLAPKVLLHDHLDGGLRPSTVVELADECGYTALPTTDVTKLGGWFRGGAHDLPDRLRRSGRSPGGSLVRYLETFSHTVAVMQTPEALARVARECAEDLAADGIVYAEIRFAPELHTENGLSLDATVEAVLDGLRAGSQGTGLHARVLCTAMRHQARSLEIAELAVRWRDQGVVGFDIAGAEAGNPPTRHLDAFQYIQRANGHFTIHAGEAFGLPSIWEAVQWCNADRLGHGVRIVDDISVDLEGQVSLGLLANYVRDTRVPLEMCPSSNVHTGAARSIETHPIGVLRDLRFRVTVNTDNRLMSDVTLSSEFATLVETFGYGWPDIRWFTLNAMKSAFLPFDQRLDLIDNVIKPGFDALAGSPSSA